MNKLTYFVITILIIGCTTTPFSGNRAFLLTSVESENRQGEEAYREILKK